MDGAGVAEHRPLLSADAGRYADQQRGEHPARLQLPPGDEPLEMRARPIQQARIGTLQQYAPAHRTGTLDALAEQPALIIEAAGIGITPGPAHGRRQAPEVAPLHRLGAVPGQAQYRPGPVPVGQALENPGLEPHGRQVWRLAGDGHRFARYSNNQTHSVTGCTRRHPRFQRIGMAHQTPAETDRQPEHRDDRRNPPGPAITAHRGRQQACQQDCEQGCQQYCEQAQHKHQQSG